MGEIFLAKNLQDSSRQKTSHFLKVKNHEVTKMGGVAAIILFFPSGARGKDSPPQWLFWGLDEIIDKSLTSQIQLAV